MTSVRISSVREHEKKKRLLFGATLLAAMIAAVVAGFFAADKTFNNPIAVVVQDERGGETCRVVEVVVDDLFVYEPCSKHHWQTYEKQYVSPNWKPKKR